MSAPQPSPSPTSFRHESPWFTVVVPTHARPGLLARCLEGLGALSYPPTRYEVVVVDDGGPGQPAAAPLANGASLSLVGQRRQGPAAARNTGAGRAEGRFVAFIDDDCRPAEDWLDRLADRLVARPAALVGGRTVNELSENACSTASQLLVDFLIRYFHEQSRGFLPSSNLALETERFRDIGGFDATFTRAAAEDREFCDRWGAQHYELVYASEAVVHHAHAMTLARFARQHFNYGRGAFRLYQRRSRLGRRFVLEPPRFYTGLLSFPFTAGVPSRSVTLASLLVLSQIANAAGFAREAVGATAGDRSLGGPPDVAALAPEEGRGQVASGR